MSRRGFTLIELLVCVAIIAMLLGLLAPALASARHSAQRLGCSANLRSLGQAFAMYHDQSRDRLPVATRIAQAATGAVEPWGTLSAFLEAPSPVWDAGLGEATTGDPWACPADDYLATATGYSYDYPPRVFFELLPVDQRRGISRRFLGDSAGVLAVDAAPWHQGTEHDRRNALHSDGSVRAFLGRVCRPD